MRLSRMRGSMLWVGCLAVLASAASAADRKPPAPTLGDLKPRNVEVQPARKVDASAQRAIENYRRYLEDKNADPEQQAEALRRLGDLNLEVGEGERMEREASAVDAQAAEAIQLYTRLLKDHPDGPANERVLYQLARAYETTGQTDKALETLDTLTRRYEDIANPDEVAFRRGEILFSAKRYPEAEKAYRASLESPASRSGFRAQSLYKRGWSLFKQGLNEESLPPFADVLEATLFDPAGGGRVRPIESLGRADRELADDTLRVMSIAFSYMEGARSLDPFIATRGTPAYSHLLYARLGDLYVEKQRYQDAADTYRAFVAREPVNENAPLLAVQAIEAYRKGGFSDLVLQGKREYVERYNFAGDFWQGRERAAYPQVVGELKTNLKDVATYFHATAQASKKPADFQAASRWYRDYLESFPEDPEAAGTNYLLAETLFDSQQFAEAAAEYEKTAYDYPRNARSGAAAYASIAAYQKQRERLAGASQAQWHLQQIDAGIRFARSFPEHPDAGGVITRAAQDVFALNDLPRAIEVANLVLAQQPPVDAAKQRIAWTIIGQSNFDLGDFERAEAGYQKARELAPANDPMRRDLSERLAASVYKQAEARRADGDGAAAVDAFLRVAAISPDPAVRATAEFDAAAQLVNLKQWDRAIPVLEGYRRSYPKDARVPDVTRNLAVAYSEAGRPGDAAAEFERIAASAAEDQEVRREALQSAADLYQKANDVTRAAVVLERFVGEFPAPLGPAIEARQRLAEFAAAAGNRNREQFWQRELLKADASAGQQRTDRSRYLAARAQLALTTPARDAFRSVRLVAPLKKSLAAKRKALDVALKGYKDAVDFRVGEVTSAANFEMAELYRSLGKDVMASERPKNLSRDEREQYDTLLEEQAFPFEEQAIELHSVNAARIRDGLYDDSVRRSYAALAELKPARYGKTEIGTDVAIWLASAPPELRSQVNGALAKRNAGDLPAAAAGLQDAVGKAGASPALLTELGLTLRLQGRLEDAAASYQQALAAQSGYLPALRNLAVLLDVYLEDPVRALPYFEQYKVGVPEDKQLNGWVVEVRQRAAKLAPPAAAPDATPPASPQEAPVGDPPRTPT